MDEANLMSKVEFHKAADDILEDFAEKIEMSLEDYIADMDITYSVRQSRSYLY